MLKPTVLTVLAALSWLVPFQKAAAQADVWTDRTSTLAGNVLSSNASAPIGIAYGGGRFFLATSTVQNAYSAAGTSHWAGVSVTSAGSNYASVGVAFGNDTFVVAGRNGRIWSAPSSTGTYTFTARGSDSVTGAGMVRGVDMRSVAFVNNRFVVVPTGFTDVGTFSNSYTEILTSADGATWTSHQFPVASTGGSLATLGKAVYRPGANAGEGQYLFPAGNHRIAVVNEAFTALAYHTVHASAGNINQLAYAPAPMDRLVAVTGTPGSGSGKLFTVTGSPTGTWTQITLPEATTSVSAVHYEAGVGFVAGGSTVTGSSPARPAVFQSTNGTTWTVPTTSPTTSATIRTVFYADGLWLAGTDSGRGLFTSGISSIAAPEFTTPPANFTGSVGQTVTLSAVVTGTQPMIFKWFKGATLLADGGRISGAATAELTITGATLADRGYYRLEVTNSVGTTNSNAVLVSLNAAAGGAVLTPFGTDNSMAGDLAHEADPERVVVTVGSTSSSFYVAGSGQEYLQNNSLNGAFYNQIADFNPAGSVALVSTSSGNHPPRLFTIADWSSTPYPALTLPLGTVSSVNIFTGLAFAANGNFTGQIQDQLGQNHGFFFNATTQTYTLLGSLPNGDIASNPAGITADGLTVAGYERTGPFNGPFIWTEAGGFSVLPDATAFTANGDVRCISPNGRYIVGFGSAIDGQGFSGTTGLRWDRGSPLGAPVATALNRPYGMSRADAFTVNDDGTAGGFVAANSTLDAQRATVWLPDGGFILLADYLLKKYNLAVPGFTLRQVTGISPDRRTLVGNGTNSGSYAEGWMLKLPEPLELPAAGLLTVYNLSTTEVMSSGSTATFLDRAVGANVGLTVALQNTGSQTLSNITASISPADSDFSIVTTNLPGTLAAAATTNLTLRFAPTAAGLRTATLTITSDDPDTPSFTLTLNGTGTSSLLSQTITFNTLPNRLTTDAPFTVSATASSGLPVSFGVMSGPATMTGSQVTLTGQPGTVTIRATQFGNSTYAAAPFVNQTFQVNAPSGPVTLTLTGLQQTYTGTPRAVMVNGAGGNAVTVTYNGSTVVPTLAGSYSVVATLDGTKTRKTGKLVIAKAPLTIGVENERRFTGQDNPVFTPTYAGFVNGESEAVLTKLPKVSVSASKTSPGGSYPLKASGAVAANYSFVYVNGTLTVESFAGRYEALLARADDSRAGAKLEITVATAGIAFTGKLTVPHEVAALPFKGSLVLDTEEETADGSFTLTTKAGMDYAVTFTLPLTGPFEAALSVEDAPFASTTSGRELFVPARGQVITHAGAYTMLLAPGVPAQATALPLPAGSGYASVTIDSKAVLKLTGKLADGTAFTASLPPDADAGYRLFAQPYKRAQSFVAGWLDLEEHPDLTGRAIIAGSANTRLTWAKAAGTKDKSYRSGFSTLDCAITLDPWRKPVKATRTAPALTFAELLKLDASGEFDVLHTSISGSASAQNLPTGLKLDAVKNTVAVLDPVANPTKWLVKFNPSTGAISGSFTLTDSKTRKVTFAGLLRQMPDADASAVLGAGHFLLPALPTDPSNELLSGDIRFELPVEIPGT